MKEPFTIHHGPGNFWQIEIPHERNWNEQYYALGHKPPRYPVPAKLVEFDYWPAEQTYHGEPAVYGFEHHKPGRWIEFLNVRGNQ